MLGFTNSQRYFLYPEPADMRKGFDSLGGLVRGFMGQDLLSGDVFIFFNKGRDKVKLLVWDGSGMVIYYKRLEAGTFEWPKIEAGLRSHPMGWHELVLLLEGVKLESVQYRKRYAHTP